LAVFDQWLSSLRGGGLATKLFAYLLPYTSRNFIIGPLAALEGQLPSRRRDKDIPCLIGQLQNKLNQQPSFSLPWASGLL